jgi:hypothetical protein
MESLDALLSIFCQQVIEFDGSMSGTLELNKILVSGDAKFVYANNAWIGPRDDELVPGDRVSLSLLYDFDFLSCLDLQFKVVYTFPESGVEPEEIVLLGNDFQNRKQKWNNLAIYHADTKEVEFFVSSIVGHTLFVEFGFEFIVTKTLVSNPNRDSQTQGFTHFVELMSSNTALARTFRTEKDYRKLFDTWVKFQRSEEARDIKLDLNSRYRQEIQDYVQSGGSDDLRLSLVQNRVLNVQLTQLEYWDSYQNRGETIVDMDLDFAISEFADVMRSRMDWIERVTGVRREPLFRVWKEFQAQESERLMTLWDREFEELLELFLEHNTQSLYSSLLENRTNVLILGDNWKHVQQRAHKYVDDAISSGVSGLSTKYVDAVNQLFVNMTESLPEDTELVQSAASARVQIFQLQGEQLSHQEALDAIHEELDTRYTAMQEAEKLHIDVQDFEAQHEIVFFRYLDMYESDPGLQCNEGSDPISAEEFGTDIKREQIVIEVVNFAGCALRCWEARGFAKAVVSLGGLHPFSRQKVSRETMMLLAHMVHGSDYYPTRNREHVSRCMQFERTQPASSSAIMGSPLSENKHEPIGEPICATVSAEEMEIYLQIAQSWKADWEAFQARYKLALAELVDKCVKTIQGA